MGSKEEQDTQKKTHDTSLVGKRIVLFQLSKTKRKIEYRENRRWRKRGVKRGKWLVGRMRDPTEAHERHICTLV